jgi:hypothetical protein
MGEIMRHLREHHPEYNSDANENKYHVAYIEMASPGNPRAVDVMDSLPAPRVIKTHLYYEYLKEKIEDEGLKAVVVVREPKERHHNLFLLHVSPTYLWVHRNLPPVLRPGS